MASFAGQALRLFDQRAGALDRLGELVIDRLAGRDEGGGIDLVHRHPRLGQLLQQVLFQIGGDAIDDILHLDRRFGQRLLDRLGEPAAFPLGFGLSYTSFEIAPVTAVRDGSDRTRATITVAVKNTGQRSGRQVVQLYAHDAEGTRHAMAGLLGLETSYEKRRLHLGYRRARLFSSGPLGPAGAMLSGHEFHYASILTTGGDDPRAEVADAPGGAPAPDGSRRGLVSGSFFHAIARME